jgi:hypothetical protein
VSPWTLTLSKPPLPPGRYYNAAYVTERGFESEADAREAFRLRFKPWGFGLVGVTEDAAHETQEGT